MNDIDDLIGRAPEDDRRTVMERLFYEHLPLHRNEANDAASIAKIADGLNMTRQGVNQWFVRGVVANERLQEIVDLPGSTFTLEILWPLTIRE